MRPHFGAGTGRRRLAAAAVAGSLLATGLASTALTSAVSAAPAVNATQALVIDRRERAVIRVNLAGDPATNRTLVSSGQLIERVVGITSDNSGKVFIVDEDSFRDTGGIIEVDQNSGVQSPLTSDRLLVDPMGAAVAADGTFLVADRSSNGGTGALVRVDPVTNVQTSVSTGQFFVNPSGVALEPNGNILVVDPDADGGKGGVLRIRPGSPAQERLSVGNKFGNPSGIAVSPGGRIFVVDPDAQNGAGGVIEVNPSTGAQTVVRVGSPFGNPTGIAIEPSGNLLVADPFVEGSTSRDGRIYRVTLADKVVTTVSIGGILNDPVGIIMAPVPPTPVTPTGVYAPRTFTPSGSCATSGTYTVPPGVTRLGFQIAGAGGAHGPNGSLLSGSHSGGSGGFGELITGELRVTPGQAIIANAGANRTGGVVSSLGGRGGDMSFLSTDPLALVDLPGGGCNTRSFLVVAGGGGGGGGGDQTFGGTGGNAGVFAENGRSGGSGCCDNNRPGRGGGGGTQFGPGAGGPASSALSPSGRTGTGPVGGGCASCDGGGGGGGWFGGGSGGTGNLAGHGGGGGGSSMLGSSVVGGATLVPNRARISPASITLRPLAVDTTTTLTAVPVPATSLVPTVLTATVSPLPLLRPNTVPIGTVTFVVDGVVRGVVTPNEVTGIAAFPVLLSAGSRRVEARYNGNGLFTPSLATTTVQVLI